jgi:hypothetical protein
MGNLYKQPKTNVQILNWIEKEVEHLEALLILCKQEDSYIPGFLSKSGKFFKTFRSIRKCLKL